MNIHMVAICGTGMGSLAGLLQAAGHRVRGSDKAFYPPMSDRLRAWGIPTVEGFAAEHIAADTELVIVGNACRSNNPEARAAFDRGLAVMSFPQALAQMFLAEKHTMVVTGTHGKTTTCSLIAYLLVRAERDPGFLIGGVPLDFASSFRLGTGPDFVVEGDEYDSAFFDKRPKFVHYRPQRVVLTSVEFDHADIYADMDAYREAFAGLVAAIPDHGVLIACVDDPEVAALAESAGCRVVGYGFGAGAAWRALDARVDGGRTRFRLRRPGCAALELELPLAGRHNVANGLAALALGAEVGIDPQSGCALLADFRGVARRMQVRGVEAGVTVVDDFAHHPTEVAATVRAARQRWPRAELVAVFEPRTNTSRRSVFQQRYPHSFAGAERVIIVPPFDIESIPVAERFDSGALVEALRGDGVDAMLVGDADAVVERLAAELAPESVVLIMSNGAFGGIHDKLLTALRARGG